MDRKPNKLALQMARVLRQTTSWFELLFRYSILYIWPCSDIKHIWCVSKLNSIFRILFPFFKSGLQATVISFFICLEKYGSYLFNYAFMALEISSDPLVETIHAVFKTPVLFIDRHYLAWMAAGMPKSIF